MINFRYHIVSLMAVFLALSVGIAVGVSLGPSVDEGLLSQAAQDRKQVTDLRTEIDRRNALDGYRENFDLRVGEATTSGQLSGQHVAVVAMPDAPGPVVQAIVNAVGVAGGTLTSQTKVSSDVFDPAKAKAVNEVLAPYVQTLNLDQSASQATRVGLALARAVADRSVAERDDTAVALGKALSSGGLANVSADQPDQAQLVVVVTAEASSPAATNDLLTAHVQLDLALKSRAGVVLAGPNSAELDSTDVLTARTESASADSLSTVDVADLSSGVTTVILAGREQLLGRQGHYGALAKADGPLPALPVR
ncbi:MAG: copper transporter [Friedmanniella sp.]|nr:copper transporter [Friedmanniella sp.]